MEPPSHSKNSIKTIGKRNKTTMLTDENLKILK